jgi:trigger factor
MRILHQRFGPAVLGEVVKSAVADSSAETLREHNLRLALPPKIDVVPFSEGADLEYKMSIELLPEIPEANFSDLDIERLAVEIPEEDIDRTVERLAEQQRQSEPVDRPAENGDIVVADVEGRLGDREIPGASGKDRQITLGSGGLIPGFEDQLLGVRTGEERIVSVTFPENYAATDLAGKEATFTVSVKEVRQKLPLAIDDELAKALGLENLAELRQEMKQSLQRNYDQAARLRLKRALLDKLAERYDFPVPPGMVDLEFEHLWTQFQDQAKRRGAGGVASEPTTPAALAQQGTERTGGEVTAPAEAAQQGPESTGGEPTAPAESAQQRTEGEPAVPAEAEAIGTGETAATGAATQGESGGEETASGGEEAVRAEFRGIAERRIRLGLLLTEIGRRNNITVGQEELNQAVVREARRHPGHERSVIAYYRQNQDALSRLSAPILEDKVVDFIVEMAKPGVRKVSPQELLALPEPDSEPVAPT